MKYDFDKITSDAIRAFKKSMLERLEAFNDMNADWERKSGFPFLHLTSKEYYLQQYFEKAIENDVRVILINGVIQKLLFHHDSNFEFLEYILDAMKPAVGPCQYR